MYTAKGLGLSGEGAVGEGVRGFGVSAGHEGFGALPAVRDEMEAIFHWTDGEGVFEGAPALDPAFTRARLEEGLAARPGIVHIATHFRLSPGDASNSVLLLGDGNQLSLDEFTLSRQLRFDGVDLLTLSACSTALGGPDSGAEIDSLGALAQDLGAKGVVATLWNVADDPTATLMKDFYTGFAEDGLSRAEALRQAQVNQIRSDHASHPYYWAPFIIMGDWR